MITLRQNEMNFFVLNLGTRRSPGEFYMIEFQSQFTKARYRVFPLVAEENPRYVKFGVDLAFEAEPLEGTLKLSPSGSWEFKLYIVDSKSLTPLSMVQVGSGLVKLEEACEETPIFSYVSDNEDAAAIIYLAKDCTDPCYAWNTATYWQLADQNWNCADECSTFGNDEDQFDDDTQYFVQCTT